jgi:hypothetical protein
VFYALQGHSVFPEAAMLCPILLRAGARFRKRTLCGAGLSGIERRSRERCQRLLKADVLV